MVMVSFNANNNPVLDMAYVLHYVTEKYAGSQRGPVASPQKHSNTCGNTRATAWFSVLLIC